MRMEIYQENVIIKIVFLKDHIKSGTIMDKKKKNVIIKKENKKDCIKDGIQTDKRIMKCIM